MKVIVLAQLAVELNPAYRIVSCDERPRKKRKKNTEKERKARSDILGY